MRTTGDAAARPGRVRPPRVRAHRVEGPDETYLLATDLFGIQAPIQITWVFDDDPGDEAIDRLRTALAAGPLHRAMTRRRVPFARHRWVRSQSPTASAPIETIADDAVGDWADARLRTVQLDPVAGVGWQLDSARTTTGRRVVSLLASHMITDGQGLYRIVAAASAGTAEPLAAAESGLRAVTADIVDAVRAIVAALAAVRILVRDARDARRRADHQTPRAARSPAASRTRVPPPDEKVPPTTLATVDVDTAAWRARAAEFGGTPNSLFTALLAGIVHRSGRRLDGPLKVCIAVSTRHGDDDTRANASGGVWIRLADPVEPGTDLGGIRSASKRAFVDYADSGGDRAADNLQAVVRLLPRRLIARLMRDLPGPDTTVSNLGATPEDTICIGGRRASRFAIRAVMSGVPASERRVRGPAIAAWSVDYDDTTTLTFFGIDPDDFGDPELLRKLISSELAGWGIGHRFW